MPDCIIAVYWPDYKQIRCDRPGDVTDDDWTYARISTPFMNSGPVEPEQMPVIVRQW